MCSTHILPNHFPRLVQMNFSTPGITVPFFNNALACSLAGIPYPGKYVWIQGTASSTDGDKFLQSRIKSLKTANKVTRCTPAACMRELAASRLSGVVVALASTLAKTEYLGVYCQCSCLQ